MITFFQVPATDLSITYLANIFGVVGNVLPTANATIFAAIFKVVNTMALTIGAIIVIYTTIVGLLKTATEGEFLGKHWSSLWVPIRMVFGIAGLFPTAGGYSIIQVFMMWIIVQGIGAADSVWSAWLKVATQIGTTNTLEEAGGDVGSKNAFNNLFKSLMCQATLARKDTFRNNNTLLYYCAANPSDPFCTYSNQQLLNISAAPMARVDSAAKRITYSMGPSSYSCGTLQYSLPTAGYINGTGTAINCPTLKTDVESLKACAVAQAIPQALQTVVNTLGAAANAFAQYDAQYINFYENPPESAAPTTITWLQNYCSALNVPGSCCIVANPKIGYPNHSGCTPVAQASPLSNDLPLPPNGCHYACENTFPLDMNTVNGNPDPTNLNLSEVPTGTADTQKLYYYVIQDYLGNAPNLITTTITNFYGTLNAAVVGALANVPLQQGTWQAQAEGLGWIMAGAYYYKIATLAGTGQTLPGLTGTNSIVTWPGDPGLSFGGFRNNVRGASSLYGYFTGSGAPSSSGQATAEINNLIGATTSEVSAGFMNLLTGTGDPILNMASFGRRMLYIAQITFVVFVATSSLIMGLASLNVIFLGAGATQSPLEAFVSFLLQGAFLVIVLVLGLMFTYGALLGIYLPLIPYIIFTFGAVGWFMSTVETMVAAPFVALGILSPGGEEIMGKATPTVGMMFNIFLRPTLMILGLAFAMMITKYVMMPFINTTFNLIMGSIDANPTPLETFFFLATYIFIVLTAVNKMFSLIHEVPDRTLRWISFEYRGYDEGGAAKGISEKQEGAAKSVSEFGQKSAQGLKEAETKSKKDAGDKRDKKE